MYMKSSVKSGEIFLYIWLSQQKLQIQYLLFLHLLTLDFSAYLVKNTT